MQYFTKPCQSILKAGIGTMMLLAAASVNAGNTECSASPSVDKTPESIVRTVVEALRLNDNEDNGIATVYCFASPGNKKMTGPIERFAGMIKSGFGDMLNHSDSEFDNIEIRDDVAIQPVWLTTARGNVVGYLFRLGKQSDGEFAGMWMTEAVYKIDPSKRRQSI